MCLGRLEGADTESEEIQVDERGNGRGILNIGAQVIVLRPHEQSTNLQAPGKAEDFTVHTGRVVRHSTSTHRTVDVDLHTGSLERCAVREVKMDSCRDLKEVWKNASDPQKRDAIALLPQADVTKSSALALCMEPELLERIKRLVEGTGACQIRTS